MSDPEGEQTGYSDVHTGPEEALRGNGGQPRQKKGRSSVRQRNNRAIQEKKDTARIAKRLEVRCELADWERLMCAFRLAPDEKAPMLASLQNREQGAKPPAVNVGGVHVGCRWVRNGKNGYWDGDQLTLSTLGIDWFSLPQAADGFEVAVDGHVRELWKRDGQLTLGFLMAVKLKVELFEAQLPASKTAAEAIHSYVGRQSCRDSFPSIPRYVPDSRFLDLNASAQCWIAKTVVEHGTVQTTHHHVGPEHSFMPNETVFFRANRHRFQTPVWVVSRDEEHIFAGLGEDYLVKSSLKRGDRFVLLPAFDRRSVHGDDWHCLQEHELLVDLVEPRAGWEISQRTAEIFALGERVRVSHCDCMCLTLQLQDHAIVGLPLPSERTLGIPQQLDDPRRLPEVEYFMDLRNRLGFNAMGLLHNAGSVDECLIECPLNRVSVMSPSSRLLFLDHWRDEQEQKAFRRVLERIRDLTHIRDA